MKKALTYSSFLVTSLLVILAFVTATTYVQLGIAVIIYPFLAYFTYRLFLTRTPTTKNVSVQLEPNVQDNPGIVESKKEDVSVSDVDKRVFLKLIGATGISFFLFSLLNRRSEDLFFRKSAEPGISTLTDGDGNKINPAERYPADGFRISEIADGETAFYGFINREGAWFIMKEDEEGSFRYNKGKSNFPGNWNNRANLDYVYFHDAF